MKRIIWFLIIGILFGNTCFSQSSTSRYIKSKVDSILKNEIVNYEELKEELSAPVKYFDIDKILVLNSAAQVLQINFGITGYKIRFLFYPADSSMFLLSFGRSDYLEYFKKGYKQVLDVCYKNCPIDSVEFKLSDALLPECYQIYFKNENDSLFFYKRNFISAIEGGKVELSIGSSKGKVFVHNTIFINELDLVFSKRRKYFICNIKQSVCKRKQLIDYKFRKTDVVSVFITKANY